MKIKRRDSFSATNASQQISAAKRCLRASINFAYVKAMKTFVAIMLLASAVSLWAQGTLFLSNLGEPGTGFSYGGGNQSFETGAASNGYVLNSITLLMGQWQGYASNFSVSIYGDNGGQAGVLVGTLSGNSDPETAGQYTYTASGVVLNSTTPYWIVAACGSSPPPSIFPPQVGYAWQVTSSTNFETANEWNIGAAVIYAPVPTPSGSGLLFQFALNTTPVPEPSTCAVGSLTFAIGMIALARSHKRHHLKAR